MESKIDKYYKLYTLSSITPNILKNEEHFNLYIHPKKEKKSECPKIIVWKDNATHQADLGEMPIDPKGYRYFLVIVEVARCRVDAEPIKNKTADTVLKAFIKIYHRGRIQPPTARIETDSGKEFDNSQVRNFFKNNIGVLLRFGEPGRHRQQCYAEKAIQAIQEPLIQRMMAQEMKTGETSAEWSEDFHNIVDTLDKKWQCKLSEMPEGLPKISKNEDLLLEGTQVRVKLEEPITVLGKKLHGKFRTGDIRWNPEIRTIKKLILSPDQPPTYLLNGSNGRLKVSRCAYTRKQLQVVQKNEKHPPNSVIRGYPERFIPEKILKQ